MTQVTELAGRRSQGWTRGGPKLTPTTPFSPGELRHEGPLHFGGSQKMPISQPRGQQPWTTQPTPTVALLLGALRHPQHRTEPPWPPHMAAAQRPRPPAPRLQPLHSLGAAPPGTAPTDMAPSASEPRNHLTGRPGRLLLPGMGRGDSPGTGEPPPDPFPCPLQGSQHHESRTFQARSRDGAGGLGRPHASCLLGKRVGFSPGPPWAPRGLWPTPRQTFRGLLRRLGGNREAGRPTGGGGQ